MLDFLKAEKKIRQKQEWKPIDIPEILGLSHCKYLYHGHLDERLQAKFSAYAARNEMPDPLIMMYAPKGNFSLRLLARPQLLDWIIYEAIGDWIYAQIRKSDPAIFSRSFSYKMFDKPGIKHWLEFVEHCKSLYNNGYSYAVTSDLTGYFDNIRIDELISHLKRYMPDSAENKKVLFALEHMLSVWSNNSCSMAGYGIPQGPDASYLLGDIFLYPIDEQMRQHKHYFRYVDDIRIFCKEELELKISLMDLTKCLRASGLNINAKKTRFLKQRKVEELFDPLSSEMASINVRFKKGHRDEILKLTPRVESMLCLSLEADPFEQQHFRFAMWKLCQLAGSDMAHNETKIFDLIENNFYSKPHYADNFCKYFSLFSKNHRVIGFLIKFLHSRENIYEWQETIAIRCLLSLNRKFLGQQLSGNDLTFFLRSAADKEKGVVSRAHYCLLAGQYGGQEARATLAKMYFDETDDYIKAAIIISVQEMDKINQDAFYLKICENRSSSYMQALIGHIKTLKSPLYFWIGSKPKLNSPEYYYVVSLP